MYILLGMKKSTQYLIYTWSIAFLLLTIFYKVPLMGFGILLGSMIISYIIYLEKKKKKN